MNSYLLFKSIHLIAVISWMAGLLYLPRIFVYHSEAIKKNKSEDLMSTYKVMEKRLFSMAPMGYSAGSIGGVGIVKCSALLRYASSLGL